MQLSAYSNSFRFWSFRALHIENLSNRRRDKYDPSISRIFQSNFWRVFDVWHNFTSHSTAAVEAASGTNCTFTKFLYASLTRDSSALSPFLCMKTPWHSAKIPRHHFSTQLATAIPSVVPFFFQCHLARRLLNFAGMVPNSCFCYDFKVYRDICQVKTF